MRHEREGQILPGRPHRFPWARRAIFSAGVLFGLIASMACAQLAGDRSPSATGQAARLMALSAIPSFAPLVQKVLPAVVNVSVRLKPGSDFVDEGEDAVGSGPSAETAPSPFEELLRRFFEQQIPRREHTALGSGFIVDPAGYIVTADHVVANADKISVIFQDNARRPAKIVGQDAAMDLALLKVDANPPLPYATWGDSDAAQVGDWILAIGNSFGLGGTVSPGILSARGRDINSGPYDDFLQIDASINRGNSGGPVFNLEGQVIGITTAIYTPSGGSVGIAFAIPANLARPVIEQLRAHGRMTRGWLGVHLQEVTPDIAKSLRLAKPEGALVAEVTEGGPAAKAGIRQGDVVLSFNGHAIERLRDLPMLVAEASLGRQAEITVWRGAREVALSPTIEERTESPSAPPKSKVAPGDQRAARTKGSMGLTLAPLTPGRRRLFHVPSTVKGALVLAIADNSPFAGLDIAPGDVIVSVDQEPVSTPRDVETKLRAATGRRGESLLILLNRRGSGRFTALTIDDAQSLPN